MCAFIVITSFFGAAKFTSFEVEEMHQLAQISYPFLRRAGANAYQQEVNLTNVG